MTENNFSPSDSIPRAPDGTILDQSQTQPSTTQPSTTTETKPNEPAPAAPAAPAATAPAGPPETYTFTAPDGAALNQSVIESATPIFRELGLDNTQAQKLVDFYNTQMKSEADNVRNAIVEMGKSWDAELRTDPKLSPHLDTIKTDVGRALDILDAKDPGLKAAFQSAMDLTMVGSNKDFVRTFWGFAKAIAPGAHVTGGNPSPNGQSPDGHVGAASAAARMYPHLVSKTG